MGEVRARLTAEAHKGWDRTITREGVTLTALVEAIGREMAEGRWRPTQRMVEQARRIDRDRRSR